MAIWELVWSGYVHGELCQNRFHFISPTAGLPWAGAGLWLGQNFVNTVIDEWRDLCATTSEVLDHWTVRNLYDDTDFGEGNNFNFMGLVGGEPVASNWVAGCRSPRLRSGWNRAYKRISGISEADIVGNNPTANWQGKFNTLANLICTPLLVGNGSDPEFLATYVMLRFEKYIDPEDGKEKYRPFGSEATQRLNMAVVPDLLYYRLTSQRTRQLGVGQ